MSIAAFANLAFEITTLKHIALLVCFILFIVVIVRLMLSRSGYFERAAQIPLDDEQVTTTRDPDEPEDALHNGNRVHG